MRHFKGSQGDADKYWMDGFLIIFEFFLGGYTSQSNAFYTATAKIPSQYGILKIVTYHIWIGSCWE